MMNYEEFKTMILEEIPAYLPLEPDKYRLELYTEEKVNERVDMIGIVPAEIDGIAAAPRVSVRFFYDYYVKHGDLEEALQGMADALRKGLDKAAAVTAKCGTGKMDSSQVIFTLLHREQNRELLKGLPHRKWHDLAIAYRWAIDLEAGLTSLVNNEMAETAMMDEESLFLAAAQNTRRLLPPKIEKLGDLLKKLKGPNGMFEQLFPESYKACFMYIITNNKNYDGAATVLYENLLHELAEKAGSDLYLLPASRHEMIAVAAQDNAEEFIEMVREINYMVVALEDQLSNQIYRYSRDTRDVTMVTGWPISGLRSIKK